VIFTRMGHFHKSCVSHTPKFLSPKFLGKKLCELDKHGISKQIPLGSFSENRNSPC
jgi:hypothetical protein